MKYEGKPESEYATTLGAGVSCRVYLSDSKNTVVMFADEYDKIEYMRFLGLVVKELGYFYQYNETYHANRRTYVVELVKLTPIPCGRETYYEVRVKDDFERLPFRRIGSRCATGADLSQLDILRKPIEFIRKHRRLRKTNLWLDGGSRNMMIHPKTNEVVPIDLIRFEMYGRGEP